jgi:uncharacterized protein YebE (UPF0316 family)
VDVTDDALAQKIRDEGIDYGATNWTADTLNVARAQLEYLRARRKLLEACGLPADDSDRLISQLEQLIRASG